MDRDPSQLLADDLAFAGVKTDPDLDPDLANGRLHGLCAADRGGRRSEGREEPVTGGVDLAAPEAAELRAHPRVMRAEQIAPCAYRRALPPGP